jgi:hypothetical protein
MSPQCARWRSSTTPSRTSFPARTAAPCTKKIDSPEGRAIYAHRMGRIEPVLWHIQQRGLRRFTLRGQAKVDTQRKLFCIVHNVANLQIYGKMAE